MPIRNLIFIGLATVIALCCYSISVKNRYASVFSEALGIVKNEALVEMSERQLFDAAMNGMMSSLDPNSSFISQEQYQAFDEDLSQEFVGVGMEVERDPEKNCIKVISPIPGTPAYNAGLRVGDCIVGIDGKSTADLSRQDAIKLIRGPRGEQVVFSIMRSGVEDPLTVNVMRDAIPVPSIYGDTRNADGSWNFVLESAPRIGYIRLLQFGRRSTEELRDAIQSLNGKIDGFVLDLRYNPGGLLNAAIEISDMFIGREVLIVQTRQRTGKVVSRRYATSKTELDSRIPMVVIVNEFSASASEIVAACLQDHSRAVVVGKQTWGKGTVQDLITMERNRSVLRLTTASYWRPSGRNIDRTVLQLDDPTQYGVSPDKGYEVLLTEQEMTDISLARRQRDQEVLSDQQSRLQPDQPEWLEVDLPLKRAVNHLLSQLNVQSAARP